MTVISLGCRPRVRGLLTSCNPLLLPFETLIIVSMGFEERFDLHRTSEPAID